MPKLDLSELSTAKSQKRKQAKVTQKVHVAESGEFSINQKPRFQRIGGGDLGVLDEVDIHKDFNISIGFKELEEMKQAEKGKKDLRKWKGMRLKIG